MGSFTTLILACIGAIVANAMVAIASPSKVRSDDPAPTSPTCSAVECHFPGDHDSEAASSLVLLQTRLEPVYSGQEKRPKVSKRAGDVAIGSVPLGHLDTHHAGLSASRQYGLESVLRSVAVYIATCFACIAFFSLASRQYPSMYKWNAISGQAPFTPQGGLLGWLYASLSVTEGEADECAGLDRSMLLEYTRLSIRILRNVGVPLIIVMSPIHFLVGEGDADKLTKIGMGNIKEGSHLLWIHAAITWIVVVYTIHCIFHEQRKFLKRRRKWLETMPDSRGCTLLVHGIPTAHRSDEELKAFFTKMFPDKVASAYCVKKTARLDTLLEELNTHTVALKKAQVDWKELNKTHDARPITRDYLGKKVDTIDYYTKCMTEVQAKVNAERKRINDEALKGVGGVCAEAGFVTFKERRDAELAAGLNYTYRDAEWVTEVAPEAADVRWEDLQQESKYAQINKCIGYGLMGMLFVSCVPVVIFVTNIGNAIDFTTVSPKLVALQAIWETFAPTLGLALLINSLPKALVMIIRSFFTVDAHSHVQHLLQKYYFCSQVLLVILVTAIGQGVVEYDKMYLDDTLLMTGRVAESLPHATDFYVKFLVLQWALQMIELTRFANVCRFIAFKAIWPRMVWDEEKARALSEPEDQDYQGMGSRSARLSINMLIGIFFGTLSPLVMILALVNACVSRAVYGYLMVFAESRKPDLGGAFWVTQLEELLVGLCFYLVLMAGVCIQRAASYGPFYCILPAFLYVAWSFQTFRSSFIWKQLSFEEVIDSSARSKQVDGADSLYVQQALLQKD